MTPCVVGNPLEILKIVPGILDFRVRLHSDKRVPAAEVKLAAGGLPHIRRQFRGVQI